MSDSELPATRKIVTAFRKRFACQRCGKCCSAFDGVKISKGEIKRLAVPPAEWNETFFLFARSTHMKQPCRFQNPSGGCTVYGMRPRTCREFPMRIEENTYGRKMLVVSERCPAAMKTLAEVRAEHPGR